MKIFVTGSTGMLGSEVIPRLLESGHEVLALARNPKPSTHPMLTYIKGDITERYCGGIVLRDVDAILHLAALTSLRDRNVPKLHDVNYLGTLNVVEMAHTYKIDRFFHCSTVYVCGDYDKVFLEDQLDIGQSPKNEYEKTKFESESFITKQSGLDWTVLRPGILTGNYDTGKAQFFEGFYRPVKAFVLAHRFMEQKLRLPPREKFESNFNLPRLNLPVRIYADPDSTLGLTPVDWAGEVFSQIINDSATSGKTYHVVPKDIPKMDKIIEGIMCALGVYGINISLEHTKNPLDLFYNRMIKDFHPYLHDQPVFQTYYGHTCPVIDAAYIERAVKYWREHDEHQPGTGREEEQIQLRNTGSRVN